MKIITLFSRILTGLVFIFSGFVKAVDPIGTSIKLTDYFDALGMDWLIPVALPLSFLLNTAEFVIGIMLLLNVFNRLTAFAAVFFMALFTPLTLWLAITDKVTDCGCFGDFIVMDNWETFYKNAVISIFVIIIFLGRNKFYYSYTKKMQIIITSVFIFFAMFFQTYNYRNLPVIDFRPFKIGNSILEGITLPEGAKKDVYKSFLFYKNLKTGKIEKFDENNYPWEDTLNWEFSNTENILVEKGEDPKIHDFSITDKSGNDITDIVLKDDNFSFLFAAYDLEHTDIDAFKNLSGLIKFCDDKKIKFYCLTSSSDEDVAKLKSQISTTIDFYKSDSKMLKTMVRSNPGLLLLKNGRIYGKWHYRNIPSVPEFIQYMTDYHTTK